MKITDYIVTICLLLPLCVFSQDKLLEKANKDFENLAYIDAIDSYRDIINNGNGSIEVYQKLADAYYYNSDLENAGKWYERMIEYRKQLIEEGATVEELPSEYYYKVAQCYKHHKLYDKANEWIHSTKNLNTSYDSRSKRLEDTPDYLEAIELQSNRYEITNFSANSSYTDFAPSMYLDNIVFSSSRGNRKHSSKKNKWTNQSYLDLFTVITNDSLDISFTKEFSKELGSRLHESTSSFTEDGTTIYFTRNNISKGKLRNDSTGVNRLKIYKSVLEENKKWSKPQELPFNNDHYSVAHPTLSVDGKKLYFASDMPGGYGNSDIYMVSVLEDGTFGEPKNLGPIINTEGRDTFPFISNSGMLYFSSDGHLGLGGLDIFVMDTNISEKKIYNVGEPVNSNADDITSNRSGGRGDDDIYSFIEIKPLVTTCKGNLKGIVKDQKSGEIIVEAKVEIKNKNQEVIYKGVTDQQGIFSIEADCSDQTYNIIISKKDFDTKDQTIQITRERASYEEIISLKNNLPEKGTDLAKLLNLKPIYFASSKALILGNTAEELNKVISFMKENKGIRIEIGSHTDSKGSDRYNMKLSQKRAISTANYIISKGIDPSRVASRGYGETVLINKCSNGVKCSKQEHALNRRSEFIVLD